MQLNAGVQNSKLAWRDQLHVAVFRLSNPFASDELMLLVRCLQHITRQWQAASQAWCLAGEVSF